MRWVISLLFAWCAFFAIAQEKMATWKVGFDAAKNVVNFSAELSAGWHLYSQFVDPMAGPIPTSFAVEIKGEGLSLKGSVTEPEPISAYDENFESTVLFFEKQVDFSQAVDLKGKGTMVCTITYMVCNDMMCLPPVDEILQIDLSN